MSKVRKRSSILYYSTWVPSRPKMYLKSCLRVIPICPDNCCVHRVERSNINFVLLSALIFDVVSKRSGEVDLSGIVNVAPNVEFAFLNDRQSDSRPVQAMFYLIIQWVSTKFHRTWYDSFGWYSVQNSPVFENNQTSHVSYNISLLKLLEV